MKPALLAAAATLAAAALGACSSTRDTSGLPRDAYMDELTADQVTTFCAWGIQKQGGSGKHSCPWGQQTIMTIAECEAKPWPHCALSMFEDCLDSLAGVCDLGPTEACTAYAVCAKDHPAAGPDAGVPGGDAGP